MTSAVSWMGQSGGGAAFIAGLSPAAWYRYGMGMGIAQWDDQSGNARHQTQETATNQPTLDTDGSLLFDGVDNFMKSGAFTLNQPITYYMLVKMVTWANSEFLLSGTAFRIVQTGASPQVGLFAGAAINTTDLAVGAWGVLTAVFNGASSAIRINLGAAVTGDAGANNPGMIVLASNSTGAGSWANVAYKELVAFPAAHDTATQNRIIRYEMQLGGL